MLLSIVCIILASSFIIGQLYFKQDSIIDLKIPCFNNNTYCSDIAFCNVTIIYPNGSVLVNNQNMTNSGAFHNYTLDETQTNILGEYNAVTICNDNGVLGSTTFTFQITGTGNENPSDLVMAMFLFFFIAILFYLMLFIFFGMKHFKSLDFDLNDLAYNFGGYFALLGYYVMENSYLGNSTIGSFAVLLLEVGSVTNIFLPLLAYLLSVTIGKQRALKMAEEKEFGDLG